LGVVLKPGEINARAWGLPGVLNFFDTNRRSAGDVYPSERFFLMDRLKDDISILDIGCAQGGFADIVGERLNRFSYTGIDINDSMIARARARHPQCEFLTVSEADYSALRGRTFDLVLVLGILHLHEAWRETLRGAWDCTAGSMIFDLRQIDSPSIEDRTKSYMKMNLSDDADDGQSVPYILVNSGDAHAIVSKTCFDARHLSQYGYRHPVTQHAVTPIRDVMAITWCADR
jgi:SAM-dependent methyltransferase